MYDWANSVYSLVITSAIFPVYYKSVAVNGDSDMVTFFGFAIVNSVLYSYALSFSFLLVALMLPFLSGVADYTGNKKYFMKFFVALGSVSCMGLFFFDDVNRLEWGILCSVMASIGFSGSLVFYNAFLPEIVTEEHYDRVSAKGYTMGYYGSVILMIGCLILIMNHTVFGFSGEQPATRFTFLLVGAWWIGFSTIPFSVLPENPFNRKPSRAIWSKGYQELLKVVRNLKHTPDLQRFLFSFFFYNMGVQTVLYLAALFGTDVLELEAAKLIGTILLIQLVAALGAWMFARVSQRWGNKQTLGLMVVLWVLVCLVAYAIATEIQFYVLAAVVGLIMGGIQSLSRSTYSKLIPEDSIEHASYFSFYDVTYNLSIVFGTFSFGLINQLTGNMRNSALALAVFFVIGLVILYRIKSKDISVPLRAKTES
jgi:MFS transporter, UMF1 family